MGQRMGKTLDLADGAAWAGEEAQNELSEMKAVMADWLNFAKDVTASDYAGQEWLDILRNKTRHILGVPNANLTGRSEA